MTHEFKFIDRSIHSSSLNSKLDSEILDWYNLDKKENKKVKLRERSSSMDLENEWLKR